MRKLFRRRTETRDRSHRRASKGGDPFPIRAAGGPETKLSRYLSRLLDANASERR